MKGNKPWRASSDGPDWMDVMTMIGALEELHAVQCSVTLKPGLFLGSCVLWTVAALDQPQSATVLGQRVWATSGEWPCKDHTDLMHCLYAGLFQLDQKLIDEKWRNLPLPGTET